MVVIYFYLHTEMGTEWPGIFLVLKFYDQQRHEYRDRYQVITACMKIQTSATQVLFFVVVTGVQSLYFTLVTKDRGRSRCPLREPTDPTGQRHPALPGAAVGVAKGTAARTSWAPQQ